MGRSYYENQANQIIFTAIMRSMVKYTSLVVLLFALLVSSKGFGRTITTHNLSSANAENGKWNWTVYINSPDKWVLREVAYVQYMLPENFPKRLVQVDKIGNPYRPFALSATGRTDFDINIKVVFKDGQMQLLTHTLKFKDTKAVERTNVNISNTFKKIETEWYDWNVFIDNTPVEVLEKIKCVQYILPNTFKEPIREVYNIGADVRKAFLLNLKSSGELDMKIRIFFKDSTVQVIKPYHLKLFDR